MEQSLCVLLVQGAGISGGTSTIGFEFAVECDVAHHHACVATVHGHPQFALPKLLHLEHWLCLPSLRSTLKQSTLNEAVTNNIATSYPVMDHRKINLLHWCLN